MSVLGRFCASVLAVLALTSTILGQPTLRKALNYDQDQRADFPIFRPSNSHWYILKSSGVINVVPFGVASTDELTPGDYDNDGIGDIAVWRETTGVWYRINSSNNTFQGQSWGISGDEPVQRDYNGDGRTDLAVVRDSGGVLTWYVNLLGPDVVYSTRFGVSDDVPIPGDYDGDGKFDLAVQRPGASADAPATFYFSNGLGFYYFQFGITTDLIAPGDYDNDGKTDLTLVRPGASFSSPLQWFIRLSGSNNALTSFNFGVTGTDTVVQNDYNGDGMTDPAVWRNSNGRFYISYRGTPHMDVVIWGEPNDIPVASYDTH